MSHSITELCTGCMACTTVCPSGAITGEKGKRHAIDGDLCINCGACGRICTKEAVIDPHGVKVARIKRSQWPKPVFDLEHCYSCNGCSEVCPAECIAMVNNGTRHNPNNQYLDYPVMANEKKCIGCGWCAETCNFGAITMSTPAPAPAAAE